MHTPLTITHQDNLGLITLNRPEKRNALSEEMWRALPAALSGLCAQPSLRAIVLRGQGAHFSAGADIAEFERVYATRESASDYAAGMEAGMRAVLEVQLPVLAELRGVCVGGGVALAMCCDLRFASDTSSFAVTPAKLGLAYSFDDTQRLAGRIGAAAASDLLFSGRMIDASEAHHLRLVDRVVPDDALEATVRDYAALLATRSPNSIRIAKHFIASRHMRPGDAQARYLDAVESADFAEGRIAFMAKRQPRFI